MPVKLKMCIFTHLTVIYPNPRINNFTITGLEFLGPIISSNLTLSTPEYLKHQTFLEAGVFKPTPPPPTPRSRKL